MDNEYKELINRVHNFDKHIARLIENRQAIITQIKAKFGKTDENIEFELNKLKKG